VSGLPSHKINFQRCAPAIAIYNFAGFYFFYPYNARLAVVNTVFVHRYLTYLSRVCKSRLSKKLIMSFRLATMFYAPVILSARY
jgi:hypothetical protein